MKGWRPDNWEEIRDSLEKEFMEEIMAGESTAGIEVVANAMHKADVEWLERYVFYVDTKGYIALKPNATKNWLAWKGKEEK